MTETLTTAMGVVHAFIGEDLDEYTCDVLAHLHKRGWLHNPCRITALETSLRNLVDSFDEESYPSVSTPSALREARVALDAIPPTAGTTPTVEATEESVLVGPALASWIVEDPAVPPTDGRDPVVAQGEDVEPEDARAVLIARASARGHRAGAEAYFAARDAAIAPQSISPTPRHLQGQYFKEPGWYRQAPRPAADECPTCDYPAGEPEPVRCPDCGH